MECARRGFVFAFAGLVLMTIGFCLATAGWFTPPVMASVLPIRLGGTVSFFVGLALLLGSCVVCAVRQRRCCRRCLLAGDNNDSFDRGRKKRREQEEEEEEEEERSHGLPRREQEHSVPLMTAPAAASGLDLPPTYDLSQNETRMVAGRGAVQRPVIERGKSTKISSNPRGILVETRAVTSSATSDVIRPGFESHGNRRSKRETGDLLSSPVDPREYLYIAPQFNAENRLAGVHRCPKAPITGQDSGLSSSAARNSSSADPRVGNQSFGTQNFASRTPSGVGNRPKTTDLGVESNEAFRPKVAATGEGRSFADLTLTLTSTGGKRRAATGDLPAQVRRSSPRPPKRCRSCEDRYLHKVSQKPEGRINDVTAAVLTSPNGGIVRDLARRTRSHPDEGEETTEAPPRASHPRFPRHPREEEEEEEVLPDRKSRPGRSLVPSRGQARGPEAGERTASNRISPVKYRRVLCPVHDRPTKPV